MATSSRPPLLDVGFASEDFDTIWLPAERASTPLGVLRQVTRYLRDIGEDSWDIQERFETLPAVKLVWAVVTDHGDERRLETYDWDQERAVKMGDDGATQWWETRW